VTFGPLDCLIFYAVVVLTLAMLWAYNTRRRP
jgi:hypothetical protein